MFSVLLTILFVVLLAEITKKITVMDSPASDEEIFFGRQTLKEVKKRIFLTRQTYSGYGSTQDEQNEDINDALRIIQTRSEPDLMSARTITLVESDAAISSEDSPTGSEPNKYAVNFNKPLLLDDSIDTIAESLTDVPISIEGSEPKKYNFNQPISLDDSIDTVSLENDLQKLDIENTQDSLLKIEDLVTDLSVGYGTDDLDNTLEIVEFILNHGPGYSGSAPNNTPLKHNSKQILPTETQGKSSKSCENNFIGITDSNDHDSITMFTPMKIVKQESVDFENFLNPLKEKNEKTPTFKTPAKPKSEKKIGSSAKKNMNRNNYQNIASPVGTYIKKSPQVPVVKDVKPKKPLPSTSSIPKLVRSHSTNKENVNLPSLAYKNAKTTKMIDIPDKDKLPKSQWANKVATSIPRSVVVKHNCRENNFTNKHEKENGDSRDSFGDLALRQADVSVCFQKSAFSKR